MTRPADVRGVAELREQIAAVDRALLEALNRRVELVASIKRYKEERGLAFVDPAREDELLDELAGVNSGPVSDDGVREVFRTILEVGKREVTRPEDGL